METVTDLELDRPHARLVLMGEFDAAAAMELRRELATAVGSGCIIFEIDAADVTFVDATALECLVWLRTTVEGLGGAATVTASSDNFRWSADVAHVGRRLGLEETGARDPEVTDPDGLPPV